MRFDVKQKVVGSRQLNVSLSSKKLNLNEVTCFSVCCSDFIFSREKHNENISTIFTGFKNLKLFCNNQTNACLNLIAANIACFMFFLLTKINLCAQASEYTNGKDVHFIMFPTAVYKKLEFVDRQTIFYLLTKNNLKLIRQHLVLFFDIDKKFENLENQNDSKFDSYSLLDETDELDESSASELKNTNSK